jgi:hypothetical protein
VAKGTTNDEAKLVVEVLLMFPVTVAEEEVEAPVAVTGPVTDPVTGPEGPVALLTVLPDPLLTEPEVAAVLVDPLAPEPPEVGPVAEELEVEVNEEEAPVALEAELELELELDELEDAVGAAVLDDELEDDTDELEDVTDELEDVTDELEDVTAELEVALVAAVVLEEVDPPPKGSKLASKIMLPRAHPGSVLFTKLKKVRLVLPGTPKLRRILVK